MHKLTKATLLTTMLSMPHSVLASDSFQETMLLNPTDSMLLAEARGRVMIYDGMKSDVVDHALDNQFDRIEHMMFTRTVTVDEAGEIVDIDDDC